MFVLFVCPSLASKFLRESFQDVILSFISYCRAKTFCLCALVYIYKKYYIHVESLMCRLLWTSKKKQFLTFILLSVNIFFSHRINFCL